MNKLFSFLAGALCGALVGALLALLLAPASGQELRAEAIHRWEEALREMKRAQDETRQQLEAQFEQMKQGKG